MPTGANNLPGSGGFEGMALNASGSKLYTLLERPLTGDADQKRLLIQEFDLAAETFTGGVFGYKLDARGTNIGDMTAINDHEFLVIERNGVTGTSTSGTPFKKIFKIDLSVLDTGGFAKKTEVVDLMNIADPLDLNGDGSTTFTFPFVTIEDVLILDAHTLLVVNDNNFPGGGGRAGADLRQHRVPEDQPGQPGARARHLRLAAGGLGSDGGGGAPSRQALSAGRPGGQ